METLIISQQAQNISITFIQRRTNVLDVGPTLYKCFTNVFHLLGCTYWRSHVQCDEAVASPGMCSKSRHVLGSTPVSPLCSTPPSPQTE